MIKAIFTILLLIFMQNTAFSKPIGEFVHEKPKDVAKFQFYDAKGKVHTLNEYENKIVVLNLWATWCKPCVDEMPSLEKLSENLKNKDVVVVPVALDFKSIEVVQEFYERIGINKLPLFAESEGQIFKTLQVRALPSTIVIDKNGLEVARVLGEIDWGSKDVEEFLLGLD